MAAPAFRAQVTGTLANRASFSFTIPATCQVDLERVRQELNAARVELASEAEMEKLCPDCEPGAIPPFGSLYHLTTLVDEAPAGRDVLDTAVDEIRRVPAVREAWVIRLS